MGNRVPQSELSQMNPLIWAYIGDAVYSLKAREFALMSVGGTCDDLHKATVKLVKAAAQADAVTRIEPLLTEQEKDVIRRARNAHTPQRAKSATTAQYHKATSLEALVGFLYLTDSARLDYIIDAIFSPSGDTEDNI